MAYTGRRPGPSQSELYESGGALENHDDLVVDANGKITQGAVTALDTALAGKLDTNGDGSQLTGIETVTKSATAPTSPAAGDMWFDTTSGIAAMKVWTGTQWDQMSNKFSATGGTESTYSSGGVNYKVHTFTSSGIFTADATGSVDILVVAGGGGGGGTFQSGSSGGGGGGAGGMTTFTSETLTSGSYTVTVGAGGAQRGGANAQGSSGGNSRFGSLTEMLGGGGAGSANGSPYAALSGGSGGGAGNHSGTGSAGSGTSGQGNNGGEDGPGASPNYTCGGGGGKGSVGQTAPDNVSAGDGGAGATNTYKDGTTDYYAAGGGGSTYSGGSPGTGGSSIGGNGGSGAGATNAVASTGSGGGGSSQNQVAGNGSGGIVIIRYAV